MSRAISLVPFHGASLVAVEGDSPESTLVAMKPIVEGMGLDWGGQHKKIAKHPVLATCVSVTEMQMPGDDQARDVTCLPLSWLPFWLATIQAERIKNTAIRLRVIEHQTECAQVLFRHFFADRFSDRPITPEVVGGVFRGVITKHDREVMIPAMIEVVRELLPSMVATALTTDSRVAAVDLVSVRQLLEEWKALPKRRRGLNAKIGHALRQIFLIRGGARRCSHTGIWLFPIDEAREYMRREGAVLVREHNSAVTEPAPLFRVVPKDDQPAPGAA